MVFLSEQQHDVAALRRRLPGASVFKLREILNYACMTGQVEVVRLLLKRGLEMRYSRGCDGTPLLLACRAGHVELVSLLLATGASPQEHGLSRRTALMSPATCGAAWSPRYEGVVRALLADRRVEVDTQDLHGKTALWWACHKGLKDMARLLLLEGGAHFTIAASGGVTPLAAAERGQHKDCVQLLKVQPRGGYGIIRHLGSITEQKDCCCCCCHACSGTRTRCGGATCWPRPGHWPTTGRASAGRQRRWGPRPRVGR